MAVYKDIKYNPELGGKIVFSSSKGDGDMSSSCKIHSDDCDDDDCDDDCGCSCCKGHKDDDDEEEEEEHSLKKLICASVLFVIALVLEKMNISFPLPLNFPFKAIILLLYFIAYILCGLGVLKEAVESIGHGKIFGEEFLMSLATVGAIFIGEYSEAVAVMILFQLGEFLEDKAVGSSRRSITSLMDIRPDTAFVKKTDDSQDLSEVLAKDVKIGDLIVVKPGNRVPLDGKVVKGQSFVDTSALTGESLPRKVENGDAVFSGFLNTSSILEILVEKTYSESSASRILELVEKSRSKKASSEKFIKRFAKVYTPLVCLAALLVALVPPLFTLIKSGSPFNPMLVQPPVWKLWLYRALELLVVSCPCALVISVPLSFFAGLGLASGRGILIKGSTFVEALAKTKTVFFDKTGTLTRGVFDVTDVELPEGKIQGLEGLSEEELKALAAHAEFYSDHPVSKSLKRAHSCPKCGKVTASDTEELQGYGIKCTLEGKRVLVGNKKLMEKEGVKGVKDGFSSNAGTYVYVAVNGLYAGRILISDVEKEDSVTVCSNLKKAGVEQTIMLTGDSYEAAALYSKKLGLDKFYADLLPSDKVKKVEEVIKSYENSGKKVAFVGDGINDAPVLSRSDVGIAMGGLGSDSAVEAADVVIMDDKPGKTVEAIKISKKIMANVKENVIFALGIKTLIMILCACGYANMWLAVFGDVGVTMLAVLNSIRLLYSKKAKKIG